MCCDVRHLTVPDPNRLGPVKYDSARRCDLLTDPLGGGVTSFSLELGVLQRAPASGSTKVTNMTLSNSRFIVAAVVGLVAALSVWWAAFAAQTVVTYPAAGTTVTYTQPFSSVNANCVQHYAWGFTHKNKITSFATIPRFQFLDQQIYNGYVVPNPGAPWNWYYQRAYYYADPGQRVLKPLGLPYPLIGTNYSWNQFTTLIYTQTDLAVIDISIGTGDQSPCFNVFSNWIFVGPL